MIRTKQLYAECPDRLGYDYFDAEPTHAEQAREHYDNMCYMRGMLPTPHVTVVEPSEFPDTYLATKG